MSEVKKKSLFSHLNEMRKRLMVSALFFITAVSVCMAKAEFVTQQLVGKADGFEFIYIAPAELLISYIRIAILCGIVISFPIICYQTWRFIRPGLTRRERKAVLFILTFGMVLFTIGALFAFEVVLPFTLKYFSGLNADESIRAMVSIQSYLNFVTNTMLTFGIVFELPIVIILLTKLGIVNPNMLIKNRKYVILIIFLLAAIITPPDVTSQVLIAVPMIVLFEISTLISRVLFRKKLTLIEAE